MNIGDWTTIEQKLLSNDFLGAVGYANGLNECVVLNAGTTRVNPKPMATTMEALFAAVYRDAGFEALGRVLNKLGITHELLNTVMFLFPLLLN